jgi:hypothetical protein
VIFSHSFVFSGRAVARADDLRQARGLVMLICSSEEAIETFHRAPRSCGDVGIEKARRWRGEKLLATANRRKVVVLPLTLKTKSFSPRLALHYYR